MAGFGGKVDGNLKATAVFQANRIWHSRPKKLANIKVDSWSCLHAIFCMFDSFDASLGLYVLLWPACFSQQQLGMPFGCSSTGPKTPSAAEQRGPLTHAGRPPKHSLGRRSHHRRLCTCSPACLFIRCPKKQRVEGRAGRVCRPSQVGAGWVFHLCGI